MNTQAQTDDTSAIDLAITFFCSVLVLFVFVAFNLDNRPDADVHSTLGQRQETRALLPPSWSAINERGSFAIWSPPFLTILDTSKIAEGVVDPLAQYQGEDGYQSFSARQETAPHAFHLTLSLNKNNIPAPWQREQVQAQASGDCPATARPFVTVFLDQDTQSLTPLLDMGQRCGLRLRFAALSPLGEEDWASLAIALSRSAYSADRIFR